MSLSRSTSSCVFSATLGATTAASMMFQNDLMFKCFNFFCGFVFFRLGFVTMPLLCALEAIALACGRWIDTMPQVFKLFKRA